MLAPEERHIRERLPTSEHVERRGSTLPLRHHPVLHPDVLAAVGVRPPRDIAGGIYPRHAGLRTASTRTPRSVASPAVRRDRPAAARRCRQRSCRRRGSCRCSTGCFALILAAVSPRWKTTPFSSCRARMKSPICGPSIRSIGRSPGATTCTSRPRVRRAAATSRPMKLAPSTTARRAAPLCAMILRLSASERSVWT